MAVLRIQLLGNVRVCWGDGSRELQVSGSARALLAYLLLQRHRSHPRSTLAGLLWGDHDDRRARSCLSTAVWRLRRQLEAGGAGGEDFLISTPAGELRFNPGACYWLDVEALEAGLAPTARTPFAQWSPAEAEAAESCLGLYRGDLLEGFYDEWALRERERLRLLVLNGLVGLMRFHGYYGNYDRAAELGQRVLVHDPLREEIHRYLMRVYAESGQRPLALQQYRTCAEALRRHLGVEPMEETRALYARLAAAPAPEALAPESSVGVRSLGQAVDLLRQAIDRFDRASSQLRHAVHLVERFSPPGSRGPSVAKRTTG
ncbi:MAG: hypothetical protein Kow0092_27450 [Deferrisomatales bacterium]